MKSGKRAFLFPGQLSASQREARAIRLRAAIAAGKVKLPPLDPFLERDKLTWWWVNPPSGIPADYEWAHYCWRTRSRRLDRRSRVEAAKDEPKAPSGATAGWRKAGA